MSAQGYVKIYDKEKFEQVVRDFFENKVEHSFAKDLLENILRMAQKYYTFDDYVIRYVERGTTVWEDTDWIYREIRWYIRDMEAIRMYDIVSLCGQLEVALIEAQLKEIKVWG